MTFSHYFELGYLISPPRILQGFQPGLLLPMLATIKKVLKIIALVLFVCIGGILVIHYWFFEGPYFHASPSGTLYTDPLPGQSENINLALTKLNPGMTCIHKFFGRDDEHVYIEYECEKYVQVGYRKEKQWIGNLVRAIYDSNKIELSEMKRPDDGESHPLSVYRLLPKKAYEQYKKTLPHAQ